MDSYSTVSLLGHRSTPIDWLPREAREEDEMRAVLVRLGIELPLLAQSRAVLIRMVGASGTLYFTRGPTHRSTSVLFW